MQLGKRKRDVLAATVDMYIRTGEPVGSKTVVKMLNHTVSSATIRNDMAELSAMGYLEQPHTSAGRIPTSAAFRLYIDHLVRKRSLSEKTAAISMCWLSAGDDPKRLIGEVSQALAETTGCASVTTTPSGQAAKIRKIEVIDFVVFRSAVISHRYRYYPYTACRFDRDVDSRAFEALSKALNDTFRGASLPISGFRRFRE